MMLTMLPISAMAADAGKVPGNANYNEDDITWIGTTSEYQKTLKAFFDAGGLRKVPVGDLAADGDLINIRYGLVDCDGAWAAQPIYEDIKAEYLHTVGSFGQLSTTEDENKSTESIFVDGYVQATRDGKMGLLDSTGAEVIPCKYDAVGLPVEGISRIIEKSGDVYYLGYWDLAQGKELVAPNKYVVSDYDATAAGYPMRWRSGVYKNVGDNRYAARFDFNGGYAMVETGKVETVTHKFGTGAYGYPSTYEEASELGWDVTQNLVYAQIIDKNGKEILSGGPYPYLGGARLYPQAGPYMVYRELSPKFMMFHSDQDTTAIFYSHLESGVVGPEGIIIPAQYHGGILPNGLHPGWVPADAEMQIIPERSLVITNTSPYERDHYEGDFYEGSLGTGVVDFNNKTIIPFVLDRGVEYDSANNVLDGTFGGYIYRPDGTKIPGTDKHVSGIVNGYVTIGEYDGEGKLAYNGVISVKTGEAYTHENLKGSSCTSVSANNTLWVNKGSAKEPKWGLVNLQGEVILPFEYEDIDAFGDTWERIDGAYATVKKNGRWGIVDNMGKEILPCSYRSIAAPVDGYISIQDYDTNKWGVYSLNSGRITTLCELTRGITMNFAAHGWGAIMGTAPINVGNSLNALFDMDTGKQITPTYLVMKPSERGLFYNTYGDCFGPDGRIVFPRSERGEDRTLVVKDGKVGYINASRLAREGKSLPTTTRVKPVLVPIKPRSYLVQYPDNQLYKVGNSFDITGLIVHYEDENGVRSVVDNSKLTFFTSGTVKLTQGRPFTTDGVKVIEIQYTGKKVDTFEVKVIGENAGNILETGDYYMQIYGKYLYPVWVSSQKTYYMELSDKKPDKPFTVKLLNYSDDRGPEYSISYDGTYIMQPSSSDGDQLRSSNIPHMWRINKYSSFCTIRDYGKQKLIVNASGQKSGNGTKVIVWSSTGSAPDNAKINFINVD
jgi:hypothetical protein